jgi:flagellar biosynthesis repressor protein FlbT
MPLRIELAPFERLLIGDTCIRNGERRSRFLLETEVKIITGKYLLLASEADTPCKRLYFLVETMYLADDPREHEDAFVAAANEIMGAVPTTRPYVAAIYHEMEAGRFHEAMKHGLKLIAYEASLLAIARNTVAVGAAPPSRPADAA